MLEPVEEEEEDQYSGFESIGEDGWGNSAEEGSVDYARYQEDEVGEGEEMDLSS